MVIGYHASHEQFDPGSLLELVCMAEDAGFASAMCSDHFSPFSERQGQSGFAWAWLGSALQATSIPFGTVTAPGYRYHPAIIAQASATLALMFPGRFWLALGSGQYINESFTAEYWPIKTERNERLKESSDIIRALWDGKAVTHYGQVIAEEARLYSIPDEPPLLIAAALTPETAEWAGQWADGLITTSGPREKLSQVIVAFKRGGGADKPLYLQAKLSYADTDEEALQGAWEQWRTGIFPSKILSEMRFPGQLDAAADFVSPPELHDHVRISSDTDKHVSWLLEDVRMGFDHIYLHNVNLNQERFIRDFGERVLPALAHAGAGQA
ncbi:MAG: TIGR03885 family FMN-dependent LLM class oxidoreductase [Dehalococcoidia bacterium]|nr:TIGR03885 family FMN-dependent LLM class oxidoreductase [Dehalococcoidia bacterium]